MLASYHPNRNVNQTRPTTQNRLLGYNSEWCYKRTIQNNVNSLVVIKCFPQTTTCSVLGHRVPTSNRLKQRGSSRRLNFPTWEHCEPQVGTFDLVTRSWNVTAILRHFLLFLYSKESDEVGFFTLKLNCLLLRENCSVLWLPFSRYSETLRCYLTQHPLLIKQDLNGINHLASLWSSLVHKAIHPAHFYNLPNYNLILNQTLTMLLALCLTQHLDQKARFCFHKCLPYNHFDCVIQWKTFASLIWLYLHRIYVTSPQS